MLESHAFFSKMVDELVEFSEYDPELADGIKWLDDQAQKIYEEALEDSPTNSIVVTILARAYLPEQEIGGGQLKIAIAEGR
ncbi:MAG: hypothetical protein P8X78_05360, partial [Nitrosopumilaceae archaeon]